MHMIGKGQFSFDGTNAIYFAYQFNALREDISPVCGAAISFLKNCNLKSTTGKNLILIYAQPAFLVGRLASIPRLHRALPRCQISRESGAPRLHHAAVRQVYNFKNR